MLFVLGFGVSHFFFMEVDTRSWKLNVRPVAYAPFVLAAVAVASGLLGGVLELLLGPSMIGVGEGEGEGNGEIPPSEDIPSDASAA
eukprot:Cvel_9740.t2-p1 / transcript=Cvel_9740.t2 / gene=Cvel_9740 / organism=Chromera_velia_CCMP2878 / gene_product=hypothetical protein / transcript_product=hypothetical protein / location=Cvel_scaffold569:46126-46380(+) / protein_length=85 / sequence_SO=supercontig / SO=protein_coding / is_pseudo=false